MNMIDPSAPRTRPGCLTEAEVDDVQAADPGNVPERLARHLAACPMCQERALFGSQPRKRRRGKSTLPTPTRAFVLLAIMILVMTAFFYTLSQLIGEPYK
jgi:hypothetical protein